MAGKYLSVFVALLCLVACAKETGQADAADATSASIIETITTQTADGVTIFGEPYFGALGPDAPLILLFHQGGSNGRGEYAGIAAWLNENGYRAIAWDQRSGGDLYGEANRTVAGITDGAEYGYCDAAPDLQAALDYVQAEKLAERIVIWGSSYSGALVFGLAADNPAEVTGLIAFSPASGEPMADCLARTWINDVDAPIFVLRPAMEMERDSPIEQRDILLAAGADFVVLEDGVHGSSMLVDERTENDMTAARAAVLDWLERVTGKGNG